MEKFPIGQWVKVLSNDRLVEYYGYVDEHVKNSYTGDDNLIVWALTNRARMPLNRPIKVVRNPKFVEVLEDEPRVFTDGEMDVALLTKDIDWCWELEKLKGAKIDG